MWLRWILAAGLVILIGAAVWAGTQNTSGEEVELQPNSAVDWIKSLDSQQPKDIQTATFALG